MAFYFNSRDSRCKSVFGAVATGARVDFNIISCDIASAVLELVSFSDGHTQRFAANSTEGRLAFSVVFERADVFFYRFALDDGSYIVASSDGSGGGVLGDKKQMFSQTVYESGFETPRCFWGGTMYQIFPDSFCASGSEKIGVPADRHMHPLDSRPKYRPDENGRYSNYYYGGDLKGITQKLGYLRELGVTVIYLNPIFEAHSNHRYNTADYTKIDPLLGTADDFRALCREADENGIKIILDGVFSHTGDDSRYFNKYGRYPDVGAYQSPDSSYFSWYKFEHYPDGVRCWWNIPTLPETDETEPSYAEFICGNVVEYWMRQGAAGFRLDVADELPDAFIAKLRAAVKKRGGLLVGEVWEDATTKVSYGESRRYFLGEELDSVMNYPLRTAILSFLRTADAAAYKNAVMSQLENYPKQAANCLMNILSTHDTERVITALASPSEPAGKEGKGAYRLSHDDYLRGVELVKLSYALLFTTVGIPCVYYGDERAMQGFGDPF